MQKFNYLKLFVLLLSLMLPSEWHKAYSINTNTKDGYNPIMVKEDHVEGMPRGSAIHASIDGHCLTVFFTENLGQVEIRITTDAGITVETVWVITPNGHQTYLPQTGDYVIIFTLPNGDEYYGEFTVTD